MNIINQQVESEILDFCNNKFDINKNYVYISYAYENKDIVYKKVLEWIHKGYNIYLDYVGNYESIEKWVENVQEKLRRRKCTLVIIFLSNEYCFRYESLFELFMIRSQRTLNSIQFINNVRKSVPVDIFLINNLYEDFLYENEIIYQERVRKLDINMEKCQIAHRVLLDGFVSLADKFKVPVDYMWDDFINSYKYGYSEFYLTVADIIGMWMDSYIEKSNCRYIESKGEEYRFEDLGVFCFDDIQLKDIKEESKSDFGDDIDWGDWSEPEDKNIQVSESNTEFGEFVFDFDVIEERHKEKNAFKSDNSINIARNMTLEEFERLFEDENFLGYLKNLRNVEYSRYKTFVDYLMAALLRGCDQKLEQSTAARKYCSYVLSVGGQFSWQSNCRRVIDLEGSGKLGENSQIFEQLSKYITLGDIEKYFYENRKGFVTKDNFIIEGILKYMFNEC